VGPTPTAMDTCKITLWLCTIATVGCSARQPISEVTVRDRDFAIVRTLTQEGELTPFVRAWEHKEEADPPSKQTWEYKIDIRGGGDGQRWLYDPTGWVAPLTVKRSTCYRIADASTFNAALGIPNKPVDPTPNDGAAHRTR